MWHHGGIVKIIRETRDPERTKMGDVYFYGKTGWSRLEQFALRVHKFASTVQTCVFHNAILYNSRYIRDDMRKKYGWIKTTIDVGHYGDTLIGVMFECEQAFPWYLLRTHIFLVIPGGKCRLTSPPCFSEHVLLLPKHRHVFERASETKERFIRKRWQRDWSWTPD